MICSIIVGLVVLGYLVDYIMVSNCLCLKFDVLVVDYGIKVI